ncbi:MAG: KEOPS complex subunit Pcc1 [Methanocella sp.]
MQATIRLEYRDAKTAQSVALAVSPDNFKTPPGLEVKTFLEQNTVVTQIECNSKLATFTATIDDLLFSASTAENALRALKKL